MSKRRIDNKLFDDPSAQGKGQQLRTANSQTINKSSTQISTDISGEGTSSKPQRTDEPGVENSREDEDNPQAFGMLRRGFSETGFEAERGARSETSFQTQSVPQSASPSPDYDLDDLPATARGRQPQRTELQKCVDAELTKYFAMLENEPPTDLYRLVMSQVESAVINYVLDVCGNNQSRAAVYLGISRGKLRSRIKELSLE